jgi:hypothetical protein
MHRDQHHAITCVLHRQQQQHTIPQQHPRSPASPLFSVDNHSWNDAVPRLPNHIYNSSLSPCCLCYAHTHGFVC